MFLDVNGWLQGKSSKLGKLWSPAFLWNIIKLTMA
jgi:hypothetical protein